MTMTMRATAGIAASAAERFVRAGGRAGGNLFPTLDNRYMVLYMDGLRLSAGADPESCPVVLLRGSVGGCPPLALFAAARARES